MPSMRWGTQPFPAVWQLPTTWQDCWHLWAALHFSHKWSRSVWRHCRRSTGGARYTAAGFCSPVDLLSLRHVVASVPAAFQVLQALALRPSFRAYPLPTPRGQATVFCNPSHRAFVFLCRPSQPPSWFCSSQASGAASVSRFRSRVSTTECPWRLFHLKPTVAAPRR